MAKRLDIDWPELQFAFDSSFGEASCYLDRETGAVVTVTEDTRAAADDEDDAKGFDPQLLGGGSVIASCLLKNRVRSAVYPNHKCRGVLVLLTVLPMLWASPTAIRLAAAAEKPDRAGQAYPNMLRVTPRNGSFKVPRDLEPGEVLKLRLTGLGENQRLRFHRCGPECRTASTEATWDASQLAPDGRVEITIQTPGRFYFWIEDFSDRSKPMGTAMFAETVRWEEQTLILRYSTGLEVVAEPVQRVVAAAPTPAAPSEPGHVAPDPEKLIRRAAREQEKGDFAAAADLFAQAARAAGGDSVAALAGLCQAELERGRYVEAISAARRWIELAGTPAERARGEYHLGLGMVQHGMDESYPGERTSGVARIPRRDSGGIRGAESFRQAAGAFRRAAAYPGEGRDAALLRLAETLYWLDENVEALAALDAYAAAGGAAPLAANLRCWVEGTFGAAERRAKAAGTARPRDPGDARAPTKVFAPHAQYTKEARRKRIQGMIIVQALVTEEGLVSCVRVLRGLDDGLDAAAVEAVRQWRFRPATFQGEPIATSYSLTMNFTLQ